MRKISIALALVVAAYGAYVCLMLVFPLGVPLLSENKPPAIVREPEIARAPVALPDVGKRLVIVVAGQSNGANYGLKRSSARHAAVLNLDPVSGGIYHADDPMIGATGNGGSWMPLLGDLLVDNGVADVVVFIPIAVGSTSIADWTTGPQSHQFAQGFASAQTHGVIPDVVLWDQGESDAIAKTSTADYRTGLSKMIAGIRQMSQAPVFVASATRCGAAAMPGAPAVRQAQMEAVDNTGVLRGPDMDTISDRDAMDCHMTEAGLNHAAQMWADVITHWAKDRPATIK